MQSVDLYIKEVQHIALARRDERAGVAQTVNQEIHHDGVLFNHGG